MPSPTLTDLFRASASRWPERIALATPGGEHNLSYRDLDALVRELASQLHKHGVRRSDTIAIVSENRVEFAPVFLAVTSVATAAPLDPALTGRQMAQRLDALRPAAMLLPVDRYEEFVTAHPEAAPATWRIVRTPGTGMTLIAPPSGDHGSLEKIEPELPRPGDVAIELLTAGTTGTPKIVPLTHANVAASTEVIRSTYRLAPDDATVLVMPLFHGHGLIAGLLATLAGGGAAYLPTGGRFHAHTFWPDMRGAGASWYTAVPTIHEILLARAGSDYPRDDPPRLRFVRSCSAPLAPEVLHELERAFSAPVLQAYGMTETAHQVTSNPLPADGPDKAGSVGLPTGVEIQVTGPDGHPVATDEQGEIWIRGSSVTSGYRDDPDATAHSFTGAWFHTGDLGHKDSDGYLYLTGRSKEIINRGGEKISPSEVDAVLQSNPKVEDAMSFGVPDDEYGEEIHAAIVLRPGQTVGERELQQYARERLSAFEVPKRIFFLAALPHTEKGTDDRRLLAEILGQRR